MRLRTSIILGAVGLFIVALLLAVVFGVRAVRKPPEVRTDSILEVKIVGEITDGPVSHPLWTLLGGAKNNVYDLRRAIDQAAADRRIRGILLEIGFNDLGWGSVEEIYASLQRFRKADKPIYTAIANDFVDEKNYYLALPASRLVMNPEAGLLVNGLYAEATFFRKALDKLYIKPEYIQFKEYKSAAEPFTRKDMSREFRESLEYVVRDIENRFVQAVAGIRKKTTAEVRAFMDSGLNTAPEAKQQGFIDDLGYREDVEKSLQETTPGGGKQQSREDELRIVSLRNYVRALDAVEEGKSRVGLVFASGEIASGESDPWDAIMGGDTVAGYIRSLRKDKAVKAIILRVNSPGGSAVGSDVIWREVRQARATGKPVVVSMGDVAGSGGYYISMGADRIVAQPSTITGSIGVVFGKLNTRGFFEWLGVTFDAVKTARNADIFSFVDSLTPEQEQRVRAWMSQVYNDFVSKAAEGRRKSFDAIESIAHGRIWSGAQAKDRALVDALGGLEEAVAQARQLAKIPQDEKIKFVIYPRRKTLWEVIFSGESPFAKTLQSRLSLIETPFFKSLQEAHVWMITPDVKIH
ncbi:MAG: signal peptide peptidase SppA [Acidobacteria bacterium]|nr:signal peptide peptidase SppA [Acidobacteriota bacterium]